MDTVPHIPCPAFPIIGLSSHVSHLLEMPFLPTLPALWTIPCPNQASTSFPRCFANTPHCIKLSCLFVCFLFLPLPLPTKAGSPAPCCVTGLDTEPALQEVLSDHAGQGIVAQDSTQEKGPIWGQAKVEHHQEGWQFLYLRGSGGFEQC